MSTCQTMLHGYISQLKQSLEIRVVIHHKRWTFINTNINNLNLPCAYKREWTALRLFQTLCSVPSEDILGGCTKRHTFLSSLSRCVHTFIYKLFLWRACDNGASHVKYFNEISSLGVVRKHTHVCLHTTYAMSTDFNTSSCGANIVQRGKRIVWHGVRLVRARLSAAIATSKFIGKINITKRVAGEAVISHKSASNKLAVQAVDTSARKQVVLTHCEVFNHTVC